MKLKCDFLFFFYFLVWCVSCISDSENISEISSESQNPSILMRGWLRYFTYNSTDELCKIPNSFFINNKYFHQFENKHKLNLLNTNIKDDYGYVHIPSKFHFFFVLSMDTIYVISARKNDVAETVQSIQLSWISPVQWKNNTFNGGMVDLGNLKEGFCFRLFLKTGMVWSLCSDSDEEKTKWMSKIFSLLPPSSDSNAESNADANNKTDIPLPFSMMITSSVENFTTQYNKSNEEQNATNESDGHWVILQDWTQCSMACNGGKQFLQRVCIPPQEGGKKCDGEPVLERPCNTFPCPNVIKKEVKVKKTKNPIIRVQRLSNRLLRYEVCIIKEGELDLLIENPNLIVQPRIPVRVILNNKTLSIFGIPNYNSIYKSFDLEFISLKKHPNPKLEKSCMIVLDVRDFSKRATLCIMPITIKGDQSIKEMRNKWVYDIKFFKEKCHEKMPKETETCIDEDEFIVQRKNEILKKLREDELDKIKEKNHEKKEASMQKTVAKAAKIALQAVEKELSYEQLVLKEEMIKEKTDQKQIQKQIELEKAKHEAIQSQLIEKAKTHQTDTQSKEFEEKIKEIQKQAIVQVQQAREKTKEKLDQMKRVAEVKKRDGKRQITNIRSKIASTLLTEGKAGNITLCNPQQTEDDRIGYCVKNMKDDQSKLDDCKNNKGDFCYTCCDCEFGKIYADLRDACYVKCDDFENGKIADWNDDNEAFFNYKKTSESN